MEKTSKLKHGNKFGDELYSWWINGGGEKAERQFQVLVIKHTEARNLDIIGNGLAHCGLNVIEVIMLGECSQNSYSLVISKSLLFLLSCRWTCGSWRSWWQEVIDQIRSSFKILIFRLLLETHDIVHLPSCTLFLHYSTDKVEISNRWPEFCFWKYVYVCFILLDFENTIFWFKR